MISLLVAGTVAGVWGMLLAIPAVAAAKILMVHYWDTRMVWPPPGSEGPAAGEPSDAGEEPGPATVVPLPGEEAPVTARSGNGEPAERRRGRWGAAGLARAWREGRIPSGRASRPRR